MALYFAPGELEMVHCTAGPPPRGSMVMGRNSCRLVEEHLMIAPVVHTTTSTIVSCFSSTCKCTNVALVSTGGTGAHAPVPRLRLMTNLIFMTHIPILCADFKMGHATNNDELLREYIYLTNF